MDATRVGQMELPLNPADVPLGVSSIWRTLPSESRSCRLMPMNTRHMQPGRGVDTVRREVEVRGMGDVQQRVPHPNP